MYEDQPLFSDIDKYLRSLNFELYDLDLNRKTRSSLSPYSSSNLNIGQVVQGQALYLRDSISEIEKNSNKENFWHETKILKLASIHELFNLPDCAIELLQKSISNDLVKNINIDEYINLLTPGVGFGQQSYKDYLENLRLSKPRINHFKRGKYSKIIDYFPWPVPQLIRRILSKIRDFTNLFL